MGRQGLQHFHNRVVCPRCDGNGFVYRGRIAELGKIVYICDECDALWQEERAIGEKDHVDFSTFLSNHGIKTNLNVVDVEYNWFK